MSKNPKWKRTERRVASVIGGKRITVAEDLQSAGQLDDVEHPIFQIQVKHRKTMSLGEMQRIFDKTAGHASKRGRVPLLVIKRSGKKRLYAILRLDQLARLTGWEKDGPEREKWLDDLKARWMEERGSDFWLGSPQRELAEEAESVRKYVDEENAMDGLKDALYGTHDEGELFAKLQRQKEREERDGDV